MGIMEYEFERALNTHQQVKGLLIHLNGSTVRRLDEQRPVHHCILLVKGDTIHKVSSNNVADRCPLKPPRGDEDGLVVNCETTTATITITTI